MPGPADKIGKVSLYARGVLKRNPKFARALRAGSIPAASRFIPSELTRFAPTTLLLAQPDVRNFLVGLAARAGKSRLEKGGKPRVRGNVGKTINAVNEGLLLFGEVGTGSLASILEAVDAITDAILDDRIEWITDIPEELFAGATRTMSEISRAARTGRK